MARKGFLKIYPCKVWATARGTIWWNNMQTACGRDARAPRWRCLRARRPRSQGEDAGETPALSGGTRFSVLGSWFSVRDARAPRGHAVLGSRFLVLGSRFLVLGSRFGTPALPGRDARAPRTSVGLRLPDSVALFRRELLRRSAARARRCRRSACDARDSPHHQSQRQA